VSVSTGFLVFDFAAQSNHLLLCIAEFAFEFFDASSSIDFAVLSADAEQFYYFTIHFGIGCHFICMSLIAMPNKSFQAMRDTPSSYSGVSGPARLNSLLAALAAATCLAAR